MVGNQAYKFTKGKAVDKTAKTTGMNNVEKLTVDKTIEAGFEHIYKNLKVGQ